MKRLVVVGNGMAGMACVEQILKYRRQFAMTVFGDETHGNEGEPACGGGAAD